MSIEIRWMKKIPETKRYKALNLFVKLILCAGLPAIVSCGSAPSQETPPGQQSEASTNTQETAPSALSPLDQSQYEQALEQLENGDFKNAVKTLRKLAQRYPSNPAIKANLATAYYKAGDFKAARDIVNGAASNSDTPPQLENISGLLFVEEKKFKEAEAAYQKALAKNKDYATAHYNIALLYDIYFQDINKAYVHYNRYLDLVGEDEDTKNWVEQLKYSLDSGN